MKAMALVYTTWPDVETAEAAARQVLGERLAACANILPSIRSLYWWNGAVEQQVEVAMVLKTQMSLSARLCDALIAAHPYDTPCIVSVRIEQEGSNTAFLRWIEEETTAATRQFDASSV